jgi:hypothetical protein
VVGAHRHVPRPTSGQLPAPAGPDARARLLHGSGIHARAAAAGLVLAPGASQLVAMDWFGLGPAVAGELVQHPGAYSTTHCYLGLGG